MRTVLVIAAIFCGQGCGEAEPTAGEAQTAEVQTEAPPSEVAAPAAAQPRIYPRDLHPVAVELSPAPACSTPTDVARAALEQRVAKGDACAAAALASLLVDSLGPPEEYDRAAGLAAAALDAGADLAAHDPVLCFLLDLAGDRERLATCHRGSAPRTALALAYGDGVPRDVPRALELARGDRPLVWKVEDAGADPSPGQQRLCELHRGASPRECAKEALVARDVAARHVRDAAVMALPPEEYARLRAAFLHFRDVDLRRRAVAFARWPPSFGDGHQLRLHELFDETVVHLAPHRELAPVTDQELRELMISVGQREELEATDPAQLEPFHPVLLLDDAGKARYTELVREAARAFRGFEREATALARTQLGPERAVALRAALWRDRMMTPVWP